MNERPASKRMGQAGRPEAKRRIMVGLLCLIVCGAAPRSAWSAPPMVKITSGQIQGRSDESANLFLGIPYAAPPVGDLRWRPPQPAQRWEGVRDATAFGPSCPQPLDSPMMMVGPLVKTNEDCLTLNLWTPAREGRGKRPVMLWIHGGGFFTGAGSEAQFDGEPYARRGVILVTMNYRLGRLGFFAHPALTRVRPTEMQGNYGLMDVLAAMRWIQSNIAAFGGDPGNVTIFGESAGGVAVASLIASPLARGLFQKAIVESGAFPKPMRDIRIDRPGIASEETLGRAFAQSRGANGPDAAAALRALPVEQITSAGSPAELDQIQAMAAPMIDGTMFSQDIYAGFAQGRIAKVPLLIGGNSLEALVWAFGRNGKMSTYPLLSDDAATLRAALGPATDGVLASYRARYGDDMTKTRAMIATDMVVGAGSRFLADQASRAGSPTYLYRFSAIPAPLRGLTMGAPHGMEVPYAFGVLSKLRNVGARMTEGDQALSRTVIDYWTTFAKTSDPNGARRPVWPIHTASNGAFLEFANQGPTPRWNADDPAMIVFEQRIAKTFTLAPGK